MQSKSDNIEIMCYDKVDEVIKKTSLETSMKGISFTFDCVSSPDWIKSSKNPYE